ncbi:MazG nucleotide pyrophosphohydrolase domain-containing protein [Aromatoleum evansii]|uniref:MazG nucleotide pyrophosphohydrolase domain-containing protein n=1 Tax=Aromatoleum evansii TaxID=59406 RepID=UPI00145DF630|nr:MazG nucleotide pyrophosphohydrolase domain-containing protein [Aromatoleum evansii]NMG29348.1 hypothetical protein [Aromatoleum evansii]
MDGHFNGLTPAQAERLAVLAEELGEAVQAIGKILRHGYESRSPAGATNREALERELGDVYAAMDMLSDAGDLNPFAISIAMTRKKDRVGQYLHHQGSGDVAS